MKVKSFSRVRPFATPWTVVHQAPHSMGFSRQEYWSGLPFPSPEDLPDPGIEPRSPTLQADALTSEPPEKPPDWNLIFRYLGLRYTHTGFPGDVSGKEPTCQSKRLKRPGFYLSYSCLGSPLDRGAWQATVHRVTESRTRLSV